MRLQLTILSVLFTGLLTAVTTVNAKDLTDTMNPKYLKAFPAASEGMKRFVIELPHKERSEDSGFQVEIIVGKQMMTDGVNLVRLSGKIEPKPLKGWGFTYYEVAKLGPGLSTLMGVPDDAPKVEEFVSIPSITIPYNSRIPLVVYAPEGSEVHYRLWTASAMSEKASEG